LYDGAAIFVICELFSGLEELENWFAIASIRFEAARAECFIGFDMIQNFYSSSTATQESTTQTYDIDDQRNVTVGKVVAAAGHNANKPQYLSKIRTSKGVFCQIIADLS
jgi:hypothetical protein